MYQPLNGVAEGGLNLLLLAIFELRARVGVCFLANTPTS